MGSQGAQSRGRPPVLVHPDPTWVELGARGLELVRNALAPLCGADELCYDHIGSTSVPGLMAEPLERDRYQAMKLRLARLHADDPDYDNYTRDKSAYFDEAQQHFGS